MASTDAVSVVVAHQPGGAERVSGEDQLVEGKPPRHTSLRIPQRAGAGVHLFHSGPQPDLDPDLAVDTVQLLGHLPYSVLHETVVTVEHRARVHHGQGEGRIGLTVARGGQGGRHGVAVPFLKEGHHPGFVVAEPGDVTSFSPLLAELPFQRSAGSVRSPLPRPRYTRRPPTRRARAA